jgi:hypothetical protein
MRRFLVVAVVGVLAACGSSGGGGGGASSGDGQKYVDAISAKMRAGASGKVFTKTQADCLANGMVDVIGVDKLNAAGLSPSKISSSSDSFKAVGQKLNADQATQLVDVIAGGKCFNFADLVIKSAESSGSNPFGKLGVAKTRCLFNKLLSGAAFKKAMVDSILGRSTDSSAFSSAFGSNSSTFKIFADCGISPSQLNG